MIPKYIFYTSSVYLFIFLYLILNFEGADKSQDSVKASEGEDSSAATDKENTSEQSKVEDGKV